MEADICVLFASIMSLKLKSIAAIQNSIAQEASLRARPAAYCGFVQAWFPDIARKEIRTRGDERR